MSIPPEIKGKILYIAEVTAVDGKADEMQKFISAIKKVADSDAEPGCLTYRVSRGAGSEDHKFHLFEEYVDQAAIDHHRSTEAFQAYLKSGVIAERAIRFREEFQ